MKKNSGPIARDDSKRKREKDEVIHALGGHSWVEIPLEVTKRLWPTIAHRYCRGCRQMEWFDTVILQWRIDNSSEESQVITLALIHNYLREKDNE